MSDPLGWARTTPGNIVEPPGAKKDNGWNAKEPVGAQYLNWWMSEIGKKFGAQILDDANVVLTSADLFRPLIQTPTANRVITLPTTGVGAGATIDLHNLATAQKFTIESSDDDDICQFQNGSMKLMALQDAPTDMTHWRILDGSGGARPNFQVSLSADQAIAVTTDVVVEFDTIDIDNNDNFDGITNYEWIPTVPGTYEFHITLLLNGLTTDSTARTMLHKNGVATKIYELIAKSAVWSLTLTTKEIANGIDDDFRSVVRSSDSAYNVQDTQLTFISSWFEGHLVSY